MYRLDATVTEERREQTRHELVGLDVAPLLAAVGGLCLRRPPTIEVRRARSFFQRTGGTARRADRRIVIYVHPLWSRIGIGIVLLHELVHSSGRPGCKRHGREFRIELARAAARAWSIDLGRPSEAALRWQSWVSVHDAIWWKLARRALADWLRSAVA